MDVRRPAAEVAIDAALAESLLAAQHPALLVGPPVRAGEGWDNVTFRVGPELAVRLPRRELAVELLLHEWRWLPTVGVGLGVEVPEPVALGEPDERFPWPWTVVRWVEGQPVGTGGLQPVDAGRLAKALRVLHRPAPEDAPANPFRGLPLVERAPVVEPRLAALGRPVLDRLWAAARDTASPAQRSWLHGDLHGGNVVTRDGRLAGLIDWGDVCGGDPATDVGCLWSVLDETEAADAFLAAYAPDETLVVRAAGWAVNYASGLLGSVDPAHERLGEAIARRLEERPPPC